jgi:RNA polymerase sigma-70 factor, ECF subfamily
MPGNDGNRRHDEMFSAAYEELRRLARRVKRAGNPTLNPTALVHEAFIKLARASRFEAESRQHLVATVVRAMRHVLVDAARAQAALSRGGGSAPVRRVPLDGHTAQAAFDPRDVLSVNFALDDLWRHDPTQGRAFELQFFGGLEVSEIAEVLDVSAKKVQRLLRNARAHLTVALTKGPAPGGTHDDSGPFSTRR